MISKLVMIGGVSLLSVSYFFQRKQKYFVKLFDQIEKSNKFHLDYVDDLSKLPLNKDIIIFGQPRSDDPQKILLKSILTKNKTINQQQPRKSQIQVSNEDRFWSLQFPGEFYMKTLSNQKIIVKKDEKQPLYAFNLLKRNQNQNFQQRVVVKNQPVCVYGKLQQSNNAVLLKTKMILGTKNESFLTFLDNQIMKYNRKNKIFALGGVLILASHGVYATFFRQPQLQKVQKTVQIQNGQSQKIKEQIQKFNIAKGKQ